MPAFSSPIYILKNNTVACIELHSNQMWKDLREFNKLTRVLERFFKSQKMKAEP